MGGLGKITLVATNYNSQVEVVRPHFDWYAWITVSQSYVIEDLLAMITGLVKSNKGGRSNEFEHHELQTIGGDSGELLTWKEICDCIRWCVEYRSL